MFNLKEQESTYIARKKYDLYGFTCIAKYPEFLEEKINIINDEISKSFPEYESYNENLHITLMGLNENLLFESENLKEVLESLKDLTIKEINLKISENGLIVAEINLDDESQILLKEYREKFEKFGFEYKYKESISILHSVIGILDFNIISQKSEVENKTLFKNIQDKLNELEKQIVSIYSNRKLNLKPKVVEFNNTELKNNEKRYCKDFNLKTYEQVISYIKNEEEKKINNEKNEVLSLIISKKEHNELGLYNKPIFKKIEKIVSIYENKLFKDSKRVEKISDSSSKINQYWQVIDLKLFVHLVNEHQEYVFTEYSFPSFTEKSFGILKTDKVVFDKEVIFLKANFFGNVKFNKNVFEKKVSFNLAKFHMNTQIKSSRFLGETYFRKTYFLKKIDFEASFFKSVALDGVTFPKNDVISMDRTSFEQVIWSDFINSGDVKKIDASRETLARLKQANSERGNYIDSNLFFAAESNSYLKSHMKKFWNGFKKNLLRLEVKDDPNNKVPETIYKTLSVIPDIIPFAAARLTNNFGTSWTLPLIWITLILSFISFNFEPNKDFSSTVNTPIFLLTDNKKKTDVDKLQNIQNEYYKIKYYDTYSYEFQESTNQKLKDNLYVSFLYLVNSSAPSFLTTNQWFVSLSGDKLALKTAISILLVYLTGAFIFALKNRTSRG